MKYQALIIEWLLLVLIIATFTYIVGISVRYVDEFEKHDPYMQKYNQVVKENL